MAFLITQNDTVRVVVVHHPSSTDAPGVAEAVVRHFEGAGTVPQAHPISTRILGQPDHFAGASRQHQLLDFGAAAFTVAVLLADRRLCDALAAPGSEIREAIVDAIPSASATTAPRGFCLALVVAMDRDALDPLSTEQAFPEEGPIQAERAYDWLGGVAAKHGIVRVLMHASRLILDGLEKIQTPVKPPPAQRSAFLSHAKVDLPQQRGGSLVHQLAARMAGTNYGLKGYLDEIDTLSGWPWRRQFEAVIERNALIAFDGDAYPSRPECQRELLHAKRSRRPILAINAVRDRQSLSFAYGGNLPVVREPPVSELAMDQLMLDLFTETLRTELWLHDARRVAECAGLQNPTLLPRPVELADLAFHVLDGRDQAGPATLVYPDPPLAPHLRELIDALRPSTLSVRALSEVV
ncbi:MAG: hypothetical protein OXL38_06065 [Gammaproteobacteria bacterium]|nr:hypothetical protein [Gammaproteobacteria bacterium]